MVEKNNGNRTFLLVTGAIIFVVLLYLFIYYGTSYYKAKEKFRDTTPRNSRNIEQFIVYDPAFPFIGFWKSDCTDNSGLAIEKTEDGLYSVTHCGPGGCFKPGTYRPNTTLVNDPLYKIIDNNTIEVKGNAGCRTSYRCEVPAQQSALEGRGNKSRRGAHPKRWMKES